MLTTMANQTGSLIVRGAQVWDGLKQGFVERDLCIQDGLIVDHPSSQGMSDDPHTMDGAGKWVLPGLIDGHFHAYAVSMDGLDNERGPLSFAALNGAKRLGDALKRGFTTVRDVAGGDIGLQHAVDQTLFPSPAISSPVPHSARPAGTVIRDRRWSTSASAPATCARSSTVSTICARPSGRDSVPERTPSRS